MKTKAVTKLSGYSPVQYVHMAVTLFFMVGFGFLPPFSTLTPVGMKLLGLFIGVVYGYSTCEIIWPSFLAIILFGLSGYHDSVTSAITAMMGGELVFQILVQQFTAGAIVIYGFGKWFVRKTLSMKCFQGKPIFYTWCFMFVFMWACIVLETISTYLLLYAIWTDIADSCGYSKDSSFRYYGFGGILVSLMLGVSMMPYKGWQLGLATSWAQITGVSINLGGMLCMTAVIGVTVITLYTILGAKLFQVDFSIMKAFDVEKLGEESAVLRPRAKRIIIVYMVVMLLSIFAGTFRSNAFADFLNNQLTITGLYCLCFIILIMLPSGEGDGKAAISFNDIKHSDIAISWPVIMMCAVTIPLASAMTKDVTGIMPWLTGLFAPLFAGKSPVFILVFIVVVMEILTNVGSNIAMGNAMIPVVAPFVMASGANPMIFGAALIYCTNMGIIFPGSSAPASVYHGRDEIPDSKKRTLAAAFGLGLHMAVSAVVYLAALLMIN